MSPDNLEQSVPELTELQTKCLEGFWNRKPAKQIAAELEISEAWVNKNLLTVRRKLHVNSSAEAALIIFGGQRGSIKSYYYQETGLSKISNTSNGAMVRSGASLALSASERPLINEYGPAATIVLIIAVALISIVGVALTISAGNGLYELLQAVGY